jgi:transposase-like protein
LPHITSDEHAPSSQIFSVLESWARSQIQGLLQRVLEEELEEFLGRKKHVRRNAVDAPPGRRNGYGKPRKLAMQGGTVTLRRPRARDTEQKFVSQVLPLFARRTREMGELLPELYLHGLAKGDFELALRGLLGDAAPLSRSSIARLRERWEPEMEVWKSSSLADETVVYMWADGIYVKAGLEKEKAALLVIVGATIKGDKRLLAVHPGYRESTESWKEVLLDLRTRGLKAPKLTVADGMAGFWAALNEVYPESAEQRCWNHKMVNVLDRLPKRLQAGARDMLREIVYAPTLHDAEEGRERFLARFTKEHPKAADALNRDWQRMVAFYSFPKTHWRHLRTTNIIESPFASARLRTAAAKRFRKVDKATVMLWKLLTVAEKRWRRLNDPESLIDVWQGRRFQDGEPVPAPVPTVAVSA